MKKTKQRITVFLLFMLLIAILFCKVYYSIEQFFLKNDDDIIVDILSGIDSYKKSNNLEDYFLIGIGVVHCENNTIIRNYIMPNNEQLKIMTNNLKDNQSYILSVLTNRKNMQMLLFDKNNNIIKQNIFQLGEQDNIMVSNDNEQIPEFQDDMLFLWSIITKIDDEYTKNEISMMCLISKSTIIEKYHIENDAKLLWDNYILVKYNCWLNFTNYTQKYKPGVDGSKYILIPVPVCDSEALEDRIEVWPAKSKKQQMSGANIHPGPK